jgi:RoxA-like, cytochrome c-like
MSPSAIRSGCLVALAAVGIGGLFVFARPESAPSIAWSRAELGSTFDAGIRNLVVEWDPADRRPAAVRRQALFDFMYETYDSSAWIPQSLFDTNVLMQAVIGDIDTIVGEKVGLVRWRDNPKVPAFGMAPNTDVHGPLRWTVNCLVCHTAEIDGRAYFGAGTKTFDELWLGGALKQLTSERWRGRLAGRPEDRALAANANRILNAHHHDKIDSLSRARSTAFAASHVEMFMRAHDGAMPSVDAVGRGDVKTPPLWHTAAKMQAGRWYTDGSFHGPYPLMASSMELEKDRSFDALATIVVPKIKAEFESVVRHLRPPRYPYAIDRALAAQGRKLFYSQDIGCYRCHGTYDGRGNVEWPGVHVDVGTDRARLDVVSSGFIAAFNASPLAAEGALVRSRGYAATPLTGVWANFPYLHNGSVPTLHHLLGPVSERPSLFEIAAARTLDRERGGQPLYADPRDGLLDPAERLRRFGGQRDWFNAARPGSANIGHDFWPQIRTDANRRALIEYLKTL